MLLARSLPDSVSALNAGSRLYAHSNAEVRKPFRDASGLDGIGQPIHDFANPLFPLASRTDRLAPLQRSCFAIKDCAGVWGVAAHVRAIRENKGGTCFTNQIGAVSAPS